MALRPLSIEQLLDLAVSQVPPSQLFEILSHYEPQACLISAGSGSPETDQGDKQLLSLFYSSFFFAHALTRQIPEARALIHRIPEDLRTHDPSIQNCITLLRAIWQVQHAQVYQALRTLPWPEVLQPLVQRYESFFQDSTLIAVSTSFEAIRPSIAAEYLGLDTDAAEQADTSILQKFTDCGWTWNPETRLLYPSPITVPSTHRHSSNGIRDAMAMLGNRSG
ncbi:COP9 signalosome subunit 8 (CsnH) [Penicillium capsulatum]|uniref:COP9 signalosome subunit 8 (CsnH) n=1 Tax=Penicillium capsulatum TaxID=69766 RepID=A0A9W9ING9_9EURO|nr:COP9 signalosome subunit 8 (CsnH) [Penicillium capsulatum]KAJ6121768.1 COP9 signalosome subunit 8 (CsnH) [Penicillium capsulatum]